MKKIGKKILWVLANIEEIIATSALAIMLISIFTNVILRYFFRNPTAWADELAIIGMSYVTFIGGAAAYKRNMHFGIDILIDRLPGKGKHILRSLMTLAFIVLFAFMTKLGYDLTIGAKKVMNYSGWSYKYMDAALPLGFLSMTIYSIRYFIMSIFKPAEFDKRYESMYDDEVPAEVEGGEAV
jgi:TRAP-type C4-dicarboxylate transport system permease small subunit